MVSTSRATFRRAVPLIAAGATALLLAACGATGGGFGQTTQHGHILSDTALQQVPIGASREQVLVALGTPSTTASFGGEVFYYISQTRRQAVQFVNSQVVDQRVVAVYFDGNGRVTRVADYGLQDGVVFDFVTQTTPTGGEDLNFIQQILRGISSR
ncbi:MAG: outer membrane protein assembly factor BamE [Bauldia sp.]|nr:outer membrane protein assembly factor BamE [Bauldia sp.]